MIHSSEEVWALDDGHYGPVGDPTARGFCTDLAGAHVPHTAGAISGCGPTELYLPSQTCYESYSATEIPLCSILLLPRVGPESESDLGQPPTGKAELTPLYGPQL